MTSLIVRYSSQNLLMLRVVASGFSSEFLTSLDCPMRRPRGCRAGVQVQERRASLNLFTNNTNHTHGAIIVLLGNRRSPRTTAWRPMSAFVRVARVAQPTSAKVAVFNTQSIGNKFAAICDRIAAEKSCFCAIVETWHDSADCPSVIACTFPGYHCLERARPRSTSHVNTMSTNHVRIRLLYASRYGARAVSLSVYKTFEVLGVYLHGTGLNLLAVVIYRPSSSAIGSTFFDEFDDALERTATF